MNTSPAEAGPHTEAILVVDDVEANRDALARRLRRRGYRVVEAAGGREALAAVGDQPFDLVLLDVMMPDVNGLDVLRSIRERQTAVELPVIMATAKTEGEDVVAALDLGANDYVTKPLDFAVVFARVKTQLDLRRAVRRSLALEGRVRRDLQTAARVQQALLPRRLDPVPGYAFGWAYRPCDELAGDALNVCQLDHDHAAMYVLDVSGHGVAAALLAVAVSRVLSPAAGQESLLLQPGDDPTSGMSPARVADRLAAQFPFDPTTEQYFTLSYGVLEAGTGLFRYVAAGHPPAVYVSVAGRPQFLPGDGLPIGLGVGYEEHTVTLAPGDRVFLYSDGVPEAMSPTGEPFGNDRLLELLNRMRNASLSDAVAAVEAEVVGWCGAARPRDDISAVGVEATAAAS